MIDTALAVTSKTHQRVRGGAIVALIALLLAVVVGLPNLRESRATGGDAAPVSQQTAIAPVFQQTAIAPVFQQTAIAPVFQQTASAPVFQQTASAPVFQQTASGVYVAVDEGGLPLITAREPNYAQTFEELVAYSSDVFVGVVESVVPIRQEGYPTPTLYFYDLTLNVTDSAAASGQGSIAVELNNVQTPFVGASWPAEGSTVVMFVVPDLLGRDAYRLVSSQGLYFVEESSSLTPTVSDAVVKQLEGRGLRDVMADVRSIMSDIDSGRLVIERPADRPIWVGPGNGDDPADEAERYANDPGSETIEPEVFEKGADHEGG